MGRLTHSADSIHIYTIYTPPIPDQLYRRLVTVASASVASASVCDAGRIILKLLWRTTVLKVDRSLISVVYRRALQHEGSNLVLVNKNLILNFS